MKSSDAKKYIAELIGTFALVLIGCGSVAIAGKYIGSVGISFAFGLTVLAMVYSIGSISGCHINPAISVAMLVARKMHWKDTVFYIIAQCVGAIIAAGILLLIAQRPVWLLAGGGWARPERLWSQFSRGIFASCMFLGRGCPHRIVPVCDFRLHQQGGT